MNNDGKSKIKKHPVVSQTEWLTARTAFLAKEKEFTRLRDDLSRQRRELPWVKVDKKYIFDGPRGKEPLADLFDKRHQCDWHRPGSRRNCSTQPVEDAPFVALPELMRGQGKVVQRWPGCVAPRSSPRGSLQSLLCS